MIGIVVVLVIIVAVGAVIAIFVVAVVIYKRKDKNLRLAIYNIFNLLY